MQDQNWLGKNPMFAFSEKTRLLIVQFIHGQSDLITTIHIMCVKRI